MIAAPGEIPAHCRGADKVQENGFSAGGAGVTIDRHKKPGSGAGFEFRSLKGTFHNKTHL